MTALLAMLTLLAMQMEARMAAITVRNIDESVKHEVQKRAVARGVSMEQHLRDLINDSVQKQLERPRLSVDEILALGKRPAVDFNQKTVTDELYAYLEPK